MASTAALWAAILLLFLGFAAAQGALFRAPSEPGRLAAALVYLLFFMLPSAAFVLSYLPWPWPFRLAAVTLAGYLAWAWSRPSLAAAHRAERGLTRGILAAAMAVVGIWVATRLVSAPSLSLSIVGAASVAAAVVCRVPRTSIERPFPDR